MRPANVGPAGVCGVFLVLALAAGTPGPADAAAAPATTPRVADPDELDEVWVRGKRLSALIEEAEDEFFELYNKLSKGNEFDVYCGRMALNRGSMIMVRACVPGFVVNNSYDYRTGTVRLSYTGFDSNSCYTSRYSDPGYGVSYFRCGSNIGAPIAPTAPMITTGQLMMSRRPAYAQNVVKVVTGDARLLDMVKRLGLLYDEINAEQQRYVLLKEARRAARPPRDTPRRHTGPRG